MKKLNYEHPVGLHIELTGKCNLQCHHCYNSSGEVGKFDISDNDWLKFFDDFLNEYAVSDINISGGEPLIRKKLLLQIVQKISSKNKLTRIRLMTNGYFVNEKFIKEISRYSDNIVFQISLDGANKISHERVRIVDGCWEKAIDACLLVINKGYKLQIASTVTKGNIHEIKELFELSTIIGANSIGIGSAVHLGRGIADEANLILNDVEQQRVLRILKNLKEEYKQFIDVNLTATLSNVYEKYEGISQDWMIVSHRGDVKVDSRLPFLVGNVRDKNSSELWTLVKEKYKSKLITEKVAKAIENKSIISNVEGVRL